MTTQILITSVAHMIVYWKAVFPEVPAAPPVINSPLNCITIPLAQRCPTAPYLIMKVWCISKWLDDGGGGNCVWLTESLRVLWSQSSSKTGEHHLLFDFPLGEELVATQNCRPELCSRPFCDNENILYLYCLITDIMTPIWLLATWDTASVTEELNFKS